MRLLVDTHSKSKVVSIPTQRFCSVVYSHSDYADVWPAYFSQNAKHFKIPGSKFLFINKKMENVPSEYEQVIYDEKLSYPERLAFCLEVIRQKGFEVCLYEHEDMILYSDVDSERLKIAINQVFQPNHGIIFKKGFDCIKLIRAGSTISFRTFAHSFIHWMLPMSRWLFAVQPSIWKVDSFISLLGHHTGHSIWELEVKAQKTVRKLGLRFAYAHFRGTKRGKHHWDNSIYPYIATAIVKGKWNFSEYPEILPEILKQNNINSDLRGIV